MDGRVTQHQRQHSRYDVRLRFLYGVTLERPEMGARVPYAKREKRLPAILSPEEVRRLLEAVEDPKHRLVLATVYAAGLRVSEVVALGVSDIDSV
jgi:integrase/recombinase XerD